MVRWEIVDRIDICSLIVESRIDFGSVFRVSSVTFLKGAK